ncbi:MAG: PepSY domain-containing protein [Pseudomonadota bacterium]|nr:PepSY domain-containing protein [Pseudomonadota bacterium]
MTARIKWPARAISEAARAGGIGRSCRSAHVRGIAVIALTSFGLLASAHAYTGEELAKDAKISLEQARGIALKAHPGKITDQELEREVGGSGLRYSFDIRKGKGKRTQEVGVDAMTGAVLENKTEGPNPD